MKKMIMLLTMVTVVGLGIGNVFGGSHEVPRTFFIAPDSSFLVEVSNDGTATLWKRTPAGTWEKTEEGMNSFYINADSDVIVTGSAIWKKQNGTWRVVSE